MCMKSGEAIYINGEDCAQVGKKSIKNAAFRSFCKATFNM